MVTLRERISQSQLNAIDLWSRYGMLLWSRHAMKRSQSVAERPQLPRLCDRIPDSQFSNYSDIDAVANSGHHST
ncbi:MAG: hypothetical protein F6J98_14495 [Moorea sp. SIO4G2]|nr:hypothetical protein [Moorena sp. SIO4G2]NEQ87227.1 hypothetical protein [Moorena sp. SIO2I5]